MAIYVEPVAIGWGAAIASAAAAIALASFGGRGAVKTHFDFFNQKRHFLGFVDSVFETLEARRRGALLATRPAEPDAPKLSATASREPRGKRPSIILILNESTFPPSGLAPIGDDPEIAGFFRSVDGRERGLRVEAFGGGTWKSEFTVLTGVPTGCYGSFGDHVFHWARNKIRHSLPQTLKSIGYRTATFCVTEETFVGIDKFMASIGCDGFFHRDSYGTGRDRHPDSFYFRHVLDWLGRRPTPGAEPDFIFMETIWNHAPHHVSYAHGGERTRGGKISGSELEEYMARLRECCRDYASFRADLAQRFPDRAFLIVHFGDHQPEFVARTPGSTLESESRYRTFYAIDGVNFDPVVDPETPDTIEAAYLGVVILQAAGVPLDAVNAARRELMIRHSGRLFFADADGAIAAQFNQRMIDAGWITPH
jgi:hypothetical protein